MPNVQYELSFGFTPKFTLPNPTNVCANDFQQYGTCTMSGGYDGYGTTGGYNNNTCTMSGGYDENYHAGIAPDACTETEYYAFRFGFIENKFRDPTT